MSFVPDNINGLASYFVGKWGFSRQIIDKKTGQKARVEGVSHFSGEDKTLIYAETGTMEYGAYQGIVTQNYIYEFTGPLKADVLFPDHRLFHKLDLKTGEKSVEHWCAPDQYNGHYRLRDPVNWSLSWKITGPRKNSIISTTYHRLVN